MVQKRGGVRAYTFWWSPEGRKVDTIVAKSERDARTIFKGRYPATYAKYMGEIYVTKIEKE